MGVQLTLLGFGVLLTAAGVAMLSIPLAMIVAGTALAAFAMFWDFGGSR